jgi:hypothetical protein
VTGAFLQVVQGVPTCRVSYQLVNQWPNGFQADVSITNTSASIPVVGYTLTWSMATGETFSSGWNATYTPSGPALSASNTAGHWNGVIAPNGGHVTFGFLGNKGPSSATLPVDFRLNGEPCATGSQIAGLAPASPALASWAPPPAPRCHAAANAAPALATGR